MSATGAARREHLPGRAQVKGTMLHAHLAWAERHVPAHVQRLRAALDPEVFRAVSPGLLATEWVPLRTLLTIDRAVAELVQRNPEEVCRAMGRHSAVTNVSGVYRSYLADEPHRFFENLSRLHPRFQDFGRSVYERVGERAGQVRLFDCVEYSPLFCAGERGYCEGALEMLKVPGPIQVAESACTCAGDETCTFTLSW